MPVQFAALKPDWGIDMYRNVVLYKCQFSRSTFGLIVGQKLMGKYLAWKVRRKHARYVENMRRGAILRANGFIPPTNNRKAV